ncbi:MAG: Gfo/Idh/MocA family oxidoreductase, partial [Polyangiaceae bacterium]|nr:Gfo/Idh/MocA family oxidoreductase [Polyangiaceae bacterium]
TTRSNDYSTPSARCCVPNTHQPPLRIAQIGCGNWGTNITRELGNHPNVALTLLIDPDTNALNRCKSLAPHADTANSIDNTDWHTLDAVVIASPGPLHATHAITAIRHCDVFIEKPMTTNLTDARLLVAACRSSNRVGMVGHLLHHHGAVTAMLTAIREGKIGTPISFRSFRHSLRDSRNVDGSVLWSLAPHDISVLRALDPSQICLVKLDRCQGSATQLSPELYSRLTMHLASGLIAQVEVSRTHHRKVRRMEIEGEHGRIVFDESTGESISKPGIGPLTLHRPGKVESLRFDRTPPLRAEINAFVQCVISRQSPQTDLAEGLAVVEILERAQAQAQTQAQTQAHAQTQAQSLGCSRRIKPVAFEAVDTP